MSTETKDPNTMTDLGHVLVTGGSGFVGQNFVKTLLEQGYQVRSFDLAPSPLSHDNLEVIEGNICDATLVEQACQGIDTIFHTAAIIELKGGKAVSQEYRDRSYAINVEGTKNIVHAACKAGTKRLVYTSSNSVVIGGQPLKGVDETTPYASRINDLYTETKVVAEQWVLAQNGKNGLLTCAVRPSGIWGPGDQTMFKRFFEQAVAGLFKATVGDRNVKLDNSYVHNLIHGQILAAQHLVEGGTAPGQAYFINDGDPVNMFEFSRPVMAAINYPFPKINVPYWLIRTVMVIWQELHFRFHLPEPPLPPLAIERIAIDNYFSI
jgi:3beta-hydroxy-delta5-steroid dehydrogenase/steroid delta-isomerase